VLIIFSFKGYAQSFLTTINTAEDDFSSSAVELRAGGYLLVISRGVGGNPYYDYSYMDIIYKLDTDGAITDSLIMDESDYYYVQTPQIIH